MSGDDVSARVLAWWIALSVVSALNIVTWIRVGAGQLRKARLGPRGASRLPWAQLLLSGLFVFGCAFRSFLPRSEGQRICLYDSWVSNAALGRAVATIAELALMTQFTMVVHALAREAGSRSGRIVSFILLPLIALAEIFSWYTTLTTNFVGSVIEESLWATTAMLMTGALAAMWPRLYGGRRTFAGAAIVMGLAYVVFMWTVDVPMYWSRRSADEQSGKKYLTVQEGWRDATVRRVVTRRWDDWKHEMPWMSLYFSAGVWMSIALVEVPRSRSNTS